MKNWYHIMKMRKSDKKIIGFISKDLTKWIQKIPVKNLAVFSEKKADQILRIREHEEINYYFLKVVAETPKFYIKRKNKSNEKEKTTI